MSPSKVAAGVVAAGVLAGGGSLAADQAINPYTATTVIQDGVSQQALEVAASSTLPDAGTNKMVADTASPRIELDKWNGEVKMGVTYDGMAPTTKGARPFLSKNVEWSDGDQTMQVVPLAASSTFEDGGYEINIVLNSKPASNVFNFSIDNADQLDFFYQPPLWQEAGLDSPTADCTDTECDIGGEGTSSRPENVVGSYAVYYKGHANHCADCTDNTNYATGKAYHIFRPLITDANGQSIWGELSYANGVLTLTVAESFLDNAAYPITIDPTFGYTSIGASSTFSSAARVSCYFLGAATEDGTTVDIQAYFSPTLSTAKVQTNLCDSNSSASTCSTAGHSTTAEITGETGASWRTLTYSSGETLTNGSYYGACWLQNAISNRFYYDSDAGAKEQISLKAYTTGSPNSTPAMNAGNTWNQSIYIDYSASGGGGSSAYDDSNWWAILQ